MLVVRTLHGVVKVALDGVRGALELAQETVAVVDKGVDVPVHALEKAVDLLEAARKELDKAVDDVAGKIEDAAE